MKAKLDPHTTPVQKFARFQSALQTVLQVPKKELDQMVMDAEKIRRQRKMKPGPKPRHSSASDHASET